MNCDRVQALMHAYVDGELDLVNALDVEEHLKSCATCPLKVKEIQALRALVSAQKAALYRPAPAYLQKQIHDSIRRANPAQPTWLTFSWIKMGALVTAVALLILAFALVNGGLASSQSSQIALEVEAAHVRSLMADHLTDVTSTDQHTVKPWFNGKLDFSPPVEDFTAQGFPLVGGRLDYVDDHPSAVLVYMRNKHIINLFIWPSQDKTNKNFTTSHNGYNLHQWDQNRMTYWAVSDVNDNDLLSFIQLVQENFK